MVFTDDFINFLVPKRSEIQEALRQLYFMSDDAKNSGTNSTELEIHGLMVGVGFSLWRAVFTTHRPLDRASNLQSSKQFLSNLIATNAVGFPQEQNSWVYGYYINNARLRLTQIVALLPDDDKAKLEPLVRAMGMPVHTGENDVYTNTHSLFLEIVKLLETQLHSSPRKPWPLKPDGYEFD